MDGFALYAFGFSGIAWGLAGFIIGRVQREARYRRDARANLNLANQRSNQRRDARAHANRFVLANLDGDASTNRDGDANRDGDRVHGEARRRTVHRYNGGVSTGPAASRGARRRTDETALAVAGYDG